ncbi:MAG: Gfo/Idh/MocA family oxidoreductase [Opitutales bacterium]|jgi:predicted dehydrogenase|nr:Gfo/Idh/MocA family oxidoreductase [Opitutales bacterium]MBT5168307.1 Gfo/Idh/MocA family oxidoreductase [Opitutales bacterium]MBT5816114.1 Gfo/Idh/MocA family oxidoreductase [Opitutales bacterium]MBT6378910.1 Gfo/Idh/MocA family oxidoreductase [Opitutales bacterium]
MNSVNRRQFIQKAAALGATSIPMFSIGKPGQSANSKINVAVVGAGGMGGYAYRRAGSMENLVAVCDVDFRRAIQVTIKYPNVPRFKDFRVMLDKMGDQIDAVAISTPDHTHFPAAIAAMERGKHVFVQKPLAHNIWQCRTLQKAAKKYNVITQMGNQGHTMGGIRRIKEWYDAGIIGDVSDVVTWTNRPIGPWFVPPKSFDLSNAAVPKELDWDLWQGPTAERHYSPEYVPVKWRGWWDYGCGALGDIGCHTFDAPFWVLGLGMPTKVEVERQQPPDPGYITMSSIVTYHFPARGDKPPVTMKWVERGNKVPKPAGWEKDKPLPEEGGMYMTGTKETLFHAGMRPASPAIIPTNRFMDMREDLSKIPRLPSVGAGPVEEWFTAIKGGPAPGSNFDYAAPLSEMVLLGALAQRSGKTIEWDAKNMKVKGHPEFDTWIKEPVRKGWEYGEDI